MEILGIDIGGSSIKGALVDIQTGVLASERIRIPTPEPQKPKQVGAIIAGISRKLGKHQFIGAGFPAIVKNGIAYSAANVHKAFIKADVAGVISHATGLPTYVLNDADAAGLAEMRFGIGKDLSKGSVLFLTIGTGIGSAFFINGQLLPNTELGHMKIRGKDAEHRASDAARQSQKLSWKHWAGALNEILTIYENLFSPDLIILGGGVSSRFEKYEEYLNLETRVVPAKLENLAGIVGAALAAAEHFS